LRAAAGAAAEGRRLARGLSWVLAAKSQQFKALPGGYMTTRAKTAARAVADVTQGTVLARVDIAAPPERVFRALTTEEVTRWWGADDMYRTLQFSIDLRPGGRWRSEGKGADGSPFSVEGEVVEVDPPRRLVQTWKPSWEEGP